jgi:hypothetical protein
MKGLPHNLFILSGLQLNQSLLPCTLHRATACSTKDLGISAVSSSKTPARVLPWIKAALDSSRPPKSKKRFSCPLKRTISIFSPRFSRQSIPNPRR